VGRRLSQGCSTFPIGCLGVICDSQPHFFIAIRIRVKRDTIMREAKYMFLIVSPEIEKTAFSSSPVIKPGLI
jgi:hypothetical protein